MGMNGILNGFIMGTDAADGLTMGWNGLMDECFDRRVKGRMDELWEMWEWIYDTDA